MATVHKVVSWFEDAYPPRLAEGWDRVGLSVGDPDAAVTRVLFAVDVTDARGIDKAADSSAEAFAGLSTQVRRLETGYVRSYALTMLGGVLLVGVVLILSQLG